MPRRSSSRLHLLREHSDKLQDNPAAARETESFSCPVAVPVIEPFDPGSYALLRRATKLVERMIGKDRTRRTRRGERMVYRVMNLMRTGQTLELEKLRNRHKPGTYPQSFNPYT